MAKSGLPVFFRDPRTGSMKQFTPSEPKDFALAPAEADPALSRILVADDGEADRFLTIWQLGKVWPNGGMLVECAADGTEALEKIHGHRYALVVLDWNLPWQDGAEVLRAMRERDLRIPVVVLSDQRREDIANELESMAAAYVNKEELDAHNFRNAIKTSMQLQAGPGVAGSDPGPMQT